MGDVKASSVLRYGLAGLLAGSALAVMAALRPLLTPTAFSLFLAAVTLSALYAGTGPALFATAVSVLGTGYLLLNTQVDASGDTIRIGLFVMTSLLIVWVAASRRRAEDERGRLLVREHEARSHAESAAELLRRVQSIIEVALGRLALDDMLRELLERIRSILGVSGALVLLLDEEDDVLVVRAAKGFDGDVDERVRVPLGSGLAGRVAAERRPMAMTDLDREAGVRPHPIEAGLRSLLDVPLLVGERVIGVISVGSRSARTFMPDEIELLELAAERIAVAIVAARAYEVEQGARRAAEAANRAKDEFLAMVSHELRTPLGTILSWAHLLRSGRLDAGGTTRAIETIDRNARLQAQLINDLLDVSRINAGKLELDVYLVDPAAAVEAAVSAVRPDADAAGLMVEAAIGHVPGALRADPDRLQQVISNLLSNAIKFTPRGGRLAVRLERAGPHVAIVVSDTGPGVAPDLLPHVFERFRQGDGPAARHGGLGLGLTIVRHLVEAHGGTVEVESPGELGGATFIVRLPLLPGDAADLEPQLRHLPSPPGGPPRADGLHVLIVDDDASTLESLRALFEYYGARVTAVPSATAASRALESVRPDVLVSDIAMPDEDGYQLIARVRELDRERGGAIPAIALTAFAADDDRVRALVAGYDVHLSKPVNPEEVVAFVTQLARRGRAAA